MPAHKLQELPFSNSFAALPDMFFSRVRPTPFDCAPELIHFNTAVAELLNLDAGCATEAQFADIFTGKTSLPGFDPLAMLYAGHQFGHYVPQLGDGRAILLGETINPRGERWELQLKGSGLTPYSRDGDGRAVLRSSIREYLCSEAMHGLGIPTTRALCLIGSRDEVYRERIESGAMITRVAPSHVRFGSFEVFFYRDRHEAIELLADYVIRLHYPELADLRAPERHIRFLETVVTRTARLVAQWQAVGFAHGVLNTDNMSILGITLDYGPYGFMESYDPGFICNHSDYHGRYAFDRQPHIGLWNLGCLARALLPLMDVEAARAALDTYEDTFRQHYLTLMAAKLGLGPADAHSARLTQELLAQMQQSGSDYSRLFRALSSARDSVTLRDTFIDRERFDRWWQDYRSRTDGLQYSSEERFARMRAVNPVYILRNYLAQIAIEKAERQDYSEIDRLIRLLQTPFDEQPDMQAYAAAAPDWASAIQVSCSS
jgi:protein adenylyltransferase